MPVSSLSKTASESSLSSENSKLTIAEIKRNLEKYRKFIQENKNKEITTFWEDSLIDAVPFSDLTIEAFKSEREFFKELCENTIKNTRSSNETQAITQKEKNELSQYLGDVCKVLDDKNNRNPIQNNDRVKLNNYYYKDIEHKLPKYNVHKNLINASIANLFRALPYIHSLLRFLVIKKLYKIIYRKNVLKVKL